MFIEVFRAVIRAYKAKATWHYEDAESIYNLWRIKRGRQYYLGSNQWTKENYNSGNRVGKVYTKLRFAEAALKEIEDLDGVKIVELTAIEGEYEPTT